MRKLFLYLSSFFLFFIFFASVNTEKVSAIPPAPTAISSESFCSGTANPTSRIKFTWSFDTDNNYAMYIWHSAMGKDYPRNDDRGEWIDMQPVGQTGAPSPLTSFEDRVPDTFQGQEIEWAIALCDIGTGWNHGCTARYGPSVTAETCYENPDARTFDCENRNESACPSGEYPLCGGPWSEGGTSRPPASCPCAFDGNPDRRAGETRIWYCAWDETPNCGPVGASCDDSTSRNGQSTCCAGLICDPRASSNGTCREPEGDGPGQDVCIICPNGFGWSSSAKECQNTNGESAQGQQTACNDEQTCVMGQGCVADKYNPGTTPLVCENTGTRKNPVFTCNTAIGKISTNPNGFARNVLQIFLAIAGGLLLILLMINGYKLMTSQGDPEKTKDAREGIIAAIAGVLLIIFSLSILRLITVDIIGIPGFG